MLTLKQQEGLIQTGINSKQCCLGNRPAAYGLASESLCYLVRAKEAGKAPYVIFERGVEKDSRKIECHPYYEVLIARIEEVRLEIARPTICLDLFLDFDNFAKVVKRPEKSTKEKMPYRDFSSQVAQYDFKEARGLILPSGARESEYMTKREIDLFGPIAEHRAKYGR